MSIDMKQQEQLERRKNQLLEIYKIHAQLASDISNRQNTTSRYYATLISALFVIFLTLLQHKGNLIPGDPDGKIALGYSLLIIGVLGVMLSLIWVLSITHHTAMNLRKHTILMILEFELEFQFLGQEMNLEKEKTSLENVDLVYLSLPKAETYIPYCFLFIFGLLTASGLWITLGRLISRFKYILNG